MIRRAALLAALTAGCASKPVDPAVPTWLAGSTGLEVGEREQALRDESGKAIAELEKAELLVSDAPLEALLGDVLRALTPPLDARAPRMHVRMVRGAERNAGAYPDGSILVSVGLLAALQSEAELAGLLGHESGHVVLRHAFAAKRFSDLDGSTARRQKLSREREWEADGYAIERMAAAGYDPAAMPRVLSHLDEEPESEERMAHFESHPDLADRIRSARVSGWRAGGTRAGPDRYEQAVSGVLLLAAELDIEAENYDRAEGSIDRHLARVPDSGRAYYLRAEMARRTDPEGHRSAAARSAYERALELEPDDPDALRALGLLLREIGEEQRSRELLQRYLRAAPEAVDRIVIERYLSPVRP